MRRAASPCNSEMEEPGEPESERRPELGPVSSSAATRASRITPPVRSPARRTSSHQERSGEQPNSTAWIPRSMAMSRRTMARAAPFPAGARRGRRSWEQVADGDTGGAARPRRSGQWQRRACGRDVDAEPSALGGAARPRPPVRGRRSRRECLVRSGDAHQEVSRRLTSVISLSVAVADLVREGRIRNRPRPVAIDALGHRGSSSTAD